jgi:hypothetical protein
MKLGDRVRVVKTNYHESVPVGSEGEVVEVGVDHVAVYPDPPAIPAPSMADGGWFFLMEEVVALPGANIVLGEN